MPSDDNAEKPNLVNSPLNRRMVLLGGTTITAASAMVSVGGAAEGETTSPQHREGCISYFPNENLAQAIVKAWSDETYEGQLLTFGRDKNADWDLIKDKDAAYSRTARALAKVDVFIDKPVVLTVAQQAYEAKGGEVAFVLPDKLGKKPTLATARVAMAVQCRGI
jgi:hypothetical protein